MENYEYVEPVHVHQFGRVCPTGGCTWNVNYCYIHHTHELLTGAYHQCFECKHVYQTMQEVIDAFNALLTFDATQKQFIEVVKTAEQPRATQIVDVPFCGLCLHDW